MLKSSLWLKLVAVCLALLVSGCGGGAGSSAPAPSGFTVTPTNGQVIVTWQASPGVDYWLMYAATAAPIDIKSPPGGHVWATKITSPYVVSGLTNSVTYSFAMNARTGGGPGGAQTASLSTAPRAAGSSWLAGAGGAGALRGVSYGTSSANGLAYLVAVGDAGSIYKTADGVSQGLTGYTWSQVTVGPLVDFKAATYAYSHYVAVGSSGGTYNITSSADLVNWIPATFFSGSPSAGVNAVASNGTTLVAVGNSGTVFYSNNALNWTAATVPVGFLGALYGVAYSSTNGMWVAVGAGGVLITSTDGGANWTTGNSHSGSDLNSVAVAAGNVFVAVGAGGTIVRSTDGSTWSLLTPGPTSSLYAVATDSVLFVAVGDGGKEFTSADGLSWIPAVTNGTTADLRAVVGSASKYVAVGLSGATLSSIN
jgi:hypothetical protein